MFAAKIAKRKKTRVLFVPLYLIDPLGVLTTEIGEFAKEQGLEQNPVDKEEPEPDLLLIFDGLDELDYQGVAAEKAVRDFIHKVEKLVAKWNSGTKDYWLRVILSGRELL
jgi:hypothetical protein